MAFSTIAVFESLLDLQATVCKCIGIATKVEGSKRKEFKCTFKVKSFLLKIQGGQEVSTPDIHQANGDCIEKTL